MREYSVEGVTWNTVHLVLYCTTTVNCGTMLMTGPMTSASLRAGWKTGTDVNCRSRWSFAVELPLYTNTLPWLVPNSLQSSVMWPWLGCCPVAGSTTVSSQLQRERYRMKDPVGEG